MLQRSEVSLLYRWQVSVARTPSSRRHRNAFFLTAQTYFSSGSLEVPSHCLYFLHPWAHLHGSFCHRHRSWQPRGVLLPCNLHPSKDGTRQRCSLCTAFAHARSCLPAEAPPPRGPSLSLQLMCFLLRMRPLVKAAKSSVRVPAEPQKHTAHVTYVLSSEGVPMQLRGH